MGTAKRTDVALCAVQSHTREEVAFPFLQSRIDSSPSPRAETTNTPSLQRAAAPSQRRCLDPRFSIVILLVLNVEAFFITNALYEASMVLACAALLLWLKQRHLAFVWIRVYAALWAMSALCLLGGPAFLPISVCFAMFRKMVPLFMFASSIITTTHVGELAYALQAFGLSGRFTVALSVALRFFPTVAREAKAVSEAMRTRGIRITPNLLFRHPDVLLEGFMVPFIHRLSVVADDLGNAVMVRGIEGTNKRTSYFEMKPGAVEVVVVLCIALITLLGVGGVL